MQPGAPAGLRMRLRALCPLTPQWICIFLAHFLHVPYTRAHTTLDDVFDGISARILTDHSGGANLGVGWLVFCVPLELSLDLPSASDGSEATEVREVHLGE